MNRSCTKCVVEQPKTNFRRANDRPSGLRSHCISCERKTSRQNSKKAWARSGRNRALVRNYGITIQDYQQLLVAQNSCCAICEISASTIKKALAVDHDHISGQVRGLLCDKCNRGIGLLKDCPSTLLTAAQYISNHSRR